MPILSGPHLVRCLGPSRTSVLLETQILPALSKFPRSKSCCLPCEWWGADPLATPNHPAVWSTLVSATLRRQATNLRSLFNIQQHADMVPLEDDQLLGSAEDEGSRKERKRATDRKAQRHHRLRHKAYVKHLENSLALLAKEHSSSPPFTGLLEENQTLKIENSRLLDRLAEIQRLATSKPSSESQSIAMEGPRATQRTSDNNPTRDNCQLDTNGTSWTHQEAGDLVGLEENVFNEIFPDDSCGHHPIEIGHPLEDLTTEDDANMSLDLLLKNNIDPALPVSVRARTQILHAEAPDQLSNEIYNPTSVNSGSTEDLALINGLRGNEASTTAHLRFPLYSTPVSIIDTTIESMYLEARQAHLAGRFDESEPTLRELCSIPPKTILAFRLMHSINRYGSMPLHNMLGTFWVQYLFLRVSELTPTPRTSSGDCSR